MDIPRGGYSLLPLYRRRIAEQAELYRLYRGGGRPGIAPGA
jgi:hypothetical protein